MKNTPYIALLTVTALFVGGILFVKHSNNSKSVVASNITEKIVKDPAELVAVDTTAGFNMTAAASDVVGKKSVKTLDLNAGNTVVLIGEVGPDAVGIAQEIAERSGHGYPVYLLINSPGGSVLDGASIVSAIQAAKGPVYTICLQFCASMASIIFETGTKRYMVDRSILMFHEAAGGLQGPFNQMKSRLRFFDRIVNKLDYEIASRIGIDPEVFKAQLANELWLDGEDAVRQNYADSLVSVRISIAGNPGGPEQSFLRSQTKALAEKIKINLKYQGNYGIH